MRTTRGGCDRGRRRPAPQVRFGADEIFSGKGSTITDDDIDVILARGDARTTEQNAKIQSDAQHNLANFSLSDPNEGQSLFTFEVGAVE